MHRSAIVFGLYLSFAIAIGAACSQPAPLETREDDDSGPSNTNGGSSKGGSGGTNGGSVTNQGGSMVSNGGSMVANGGTLPSNGGASGSPTTTAGGASGMMSGAGRASTTGGSAGTATTQGGSAGTATAMGGTTSGSAGTTSGSAGTGTSTVSCDAAFAVSSAGLVRAPMKGGACWHGYASAGADADSTGMPTTFEMCGEGCKLKVAGSLAASDESYAYLGFNVNEGNGTKGTMKPTGTGLKVTFTKTGTFDVRVQIAAGSTRWCANVTSSPASVPYTMLKTECWGDTGKAYAMEAIDQIQLNVPGKMAAATAYDVTLVSVEEM